MPNFDFLMRLNTFFVKMRKWLKMANTRSYDIIKMKELVHDIDSKAYITISEVADVFSNSN